MQHQQKSISTIKNSDKRMSNKKSQQKQLQQQQQQQQFIDGRKKVAVNIDSAKRSNDKTSKNRRTICEGRRTMATATANTTVIALTMTEGNEDVSDTNTVANVETESDMSDVEENGSDSAEFITDGSLFCRHCLRPQSELQLRYLQPSQRSKLRQLRLQHSQQQQQQQQQTYHNQQKPSKLCQTSSRHSSRQRHSKNRARSRGRLANMASCAELGNLQHTSSCRNLNAANELAIRFRCPQVGPQVGRADVHLPMPMHFHHPQFQQHFAYQHQLLLQKQQLQQHQWYVHQQHQQQHQHYQPKRPNYQPTTIAAATTTITIECESKKRSQKPNRQELQSRRPQHPTQNQKHFLNSITASEAEMPTTSTALLPANTFHTRPSQATIATATVATAMSAPDSYRKQQVNLSPAPCQLHMAATTATAIARPASTLQLPLSRSEIAVPLASATATTTTIGTTKIGTQVSTTTTPNAQNQTQITIDEDMENGVEEQEQSTPDSPSLVKVRTWYTVAKQGISC